MGIPHVLVMVFMGLAGKNGRYNERRGFPVPPCLLGIDSGILTPEEKFALSGA